MEAGVGDFGDGLGVGEDFVKVGFFGSGGDDFGEHGEGDVELCFAEVFDVLVGAWFLAGEVVGGKAEDFEAAVLVGVVELFEAFVLRGEAAFAGGVDDEEDLALVLLEGGGFSGEGGEREIVETGHKARVHGGMGDENRLQEGACRVKSGVMRMRAEFTLAGLAALIGLGGCAGNVPCSATATGGLGIAGDGTQLIHTADHTAAAPGNQVQFRAESSPGNTNPSCPVPTYILNVHAQWTSSDPNVTVSSADDATNGLATCVGGGRCRPRR